MKSLAHLQPVGGNTSEVELPQDQLLKRSIDQIYAHDAFACWASMLCVVMVYVVFWSSVSVSLLHGWTACYLGLMLIRRHHKSEYTEARHHSNPQTVLRRLYSTQFASGCLWGVLCAYLTLSATTTQLLLVAVVTAGLTGGAALFYSIHIRTYALFTLPLVLPVVFSLLFRPETHLSTIAALMGIWYALLFLAVDRYRRFFVQSLRFSLENQNMAEGLAEKNLRVQELNQTLREKILALKKTQDALVEEKNRAATLVKDLQVLSVLDPLTNIPNRRKFDETLEREWLRAIRYESELSLILCDLDHFKRFNDYYGHQMGDECLIKVAETVDLVARRAGDYAARYGGEEFAMVLPDTPSRQAMRVAERARQAISALEIPHQRSLERQVTMSFGVASLIPTVDNKQEELIQCADHALYYAKSRGRNRVERHDRHDYGQRRARYQAK